MRCIGCHQHVPYDAYTCPNCGLTQVSGQGLDEYQEIEQQYQAEQEALGGGHDVDDLVGKDDICDIGERVVASFIDAFVVVGAMIGLMYLNGGEIRDFEGGSDQLLTRTFSETYAFAFLYHWLLTASPLRATFGKKAMSIVVVDRWGQRIGIVRAFARELAKWTISSITFLGLIWTAVDDMGQSWHDKIVGTYVVDEVE